MENRNLGNCACPSWLVLIPLIGFDLEDAWQLQGKDFAEFASDVCLDLRAHGRLFALASGAPSGKRLKFWDLPYVRRLCDVAGPLHGSFNSPAVCRVTAAQRLHGGLCRLSFFIFFFPVLPAATNHQHVRLAVPAIFPTCRPGGWLSNIRFHCLLPGSSRCAPRWKLGTGASMLLASVSMLSLPKRRQVTSVTLPKFSPTHPFGGRGAAGLRKSGMGQQAEPAWFWMM